MAVNYKIYQSKTNNLTNGNYYARIAYSDPVDLKKLAEKMQANCTVKYSDIVAVLTELGETMKNELLNSKPVKITGLGTFRLSLKSKGAKTLKDFSVQHNITGVRVRFFPESYKDQALGKNVKPMLSGIKFTELQEYKSVKHAEVTEE